MGYGDGDLDGGDGVLGGSDGDGDLGLRRRADDLVCLSLLEGSPSIVNLGQIKSQPVNMSKRSTVDGSSQHGFGHQTFTGNLVLNDFLFESQVQYDHNFKQFDSRT